MARSEAVYARSVTEVEWLASPYTRAGFADARARRPFHPDYDRWKDGDQWWYEWGRQFAVANPALRKILLGNAINAEAVTAARRSVAEGVFAVGGRLAP